MGKIKDITGQRFGRLVVIRRNGISKDKRAKWLCKCDCGNEISVIGKSLRNGNTKSCGCLQKELASENLRKGTLESWQNEEKRKRMTEGASKGSKSRWSNEESRQKHHEMMKERWQNEDYRKEREEVYRNMMKERWQDEEYSKAHSGKNHSRYNPNLTEEEREDRRNNPKYREWQYRVKEEANFTCDCCGDNRGGNLVSHHLNCHKCYKEQRYDLDNGVCLCEKCHNEFHCWMGGYDKKCSKEDYYKWREEKCHQVLTGDK